jgi:prepilin peptidase CpaA
MTWSISNGIQYLAVATCMALLLAAAIGDLRRYRISNRLVVGVVVCFAVFAVAEASWTFIGWSLAAAGCIFALVATLFAFGLFGGGDTKLATAMALWIQFPDLLRFLLVMTASGGVLGVIWMIRRRWQRQRLAASADAGAAAGADGSASQSTAVMPNKLPYGVAIAIAGADFFLFSPNSPLAGVLTGQ